MKTQAGQLLLLISFLLLAVICFSQTNKLRNNYDSTIGINNKIWGNSTFFGAGINFARNQEYEFALGRTYGRLDFDNYYFDWRTSTWGAAYSVINTPGENRHAIKAFYEKEHLAFLIPLYYLRAEYLYNLTDKQSYLRPSVGLCLGFLSVSYNYSFLLNDDDDTGNLLRHGFSIRLKYFASRKNWYRTFTK